MSKSKKQRKVDQREIVEARRLTPGKVLRLVLKSVVFALLVALIVTLLGALGVPITENFWLQLLVMLGVYILAYPYLMSEFRPPRKRPQR
jgi:flagellar biosynthesis protein FliQ